MIRRPLLIPEWRHVLKHAWSVRLAIIAGFFAGLESILPLFANEFPRGVFAVFSMIFAIATPVSRLFAQKSMKVDDGNQ